MKGGPVIQRQSRGLIIGEKRFAQLFAVSRTVANATCFWNPVFARRCKELRTFAANFFPTVEKRPNSGQFVFSSGSFIDQWVRYLSDSRLFLGNRQVGEDLEIGLAGHKGLPLILGQVATGSAAGEGQQILNL